MKKLIISITVALSTAVFVPVYGQGFLNKISKGLDKVNKELDKAAGKSTETTSSSTGETANVSSSDAYKGVKIKSFSSKVDITLESCIRNGNIVKISYTLKNRGKGLNVISLGTTKSKYLNPNDGAAFYDNMGNSYNLHYLTFGNEYSVRENKLIDVIFPENVAIRGTIEIAGVNPKINLLSVVDMAGIIRTDDGYNPFTFTFKNVPIYTLDETLAMMQPTVLASVENPSVSRIAWEGSGIKSVVVTDKYTRVDIFWKNNQKEGSYIVVSEPKNQRIEANGKKYMLQQFDGISIHKDDVFVKVGQTTYYTLIFEPIPATTTSFDLIGDGDDFFGVKMTKEIVVAAIKTDLKKANLKGRVKSIIEKEGLKQVNTYKYNENGMLISADYKDLTKSAYPRSGSITCTYNDLNLLSVKVIKVATNGQINYLNEGFNFPQNCTYTYDQNGRLIKCYDTQDKSTRVYEYNGNGQVAKEVKTATGVEPYILLYVYDDRGNMTAMHSDKISEYPIESFKYDSKNRVIEEKSGGQTFELNYNDRGDPVSRIYDDFDGIPQFDSFVYTYDAQGNWTKKVWKNTKGLVVSTETRTLVYY